MSTRLHISSSRLLFACHRTLRSLTYRCPRLLEGVDAYISERYIERLGVKISSIATYTSKRELNTLFSLAVDCGPNAIALEIGSYLGASSCYIAAGLARGYGHLYCVDTWQNETMPEGEIDTLAVFSANVHNLRSQITPIRKRSDALTVTDVSLPLSLVFIDGDHSYPAVRSDFRRVSPWVAPNGLVAFHDANRSYEGVTRVIGEALATGGWVIGGYVESLVWLRRSS